MIYTEAQIIRKGYSYERSPNYNTAREINQWLLKTLSHYPEHKAEILRLWDAGRAEGRAR
jgi:hypothetical protein